MNRMLATLKRIGWRRMLMGSVALALLGAYILLEIAGRVGAAGEGRIYTTADVPSRRVAIVFGARMRKDGTPGIAARQRLETALDLYREGRVRKVLVSGNNQIRHNRESDAMREWLIAQGIPPADVQCDHAGFRTLDTCARAARVWNFDEEVILVTHAYHLPRALYLADAFNLNAIGVAADTTRHTPPVRDRGREVIARLVAWVDVNLIDRQPKYYGSPEVL